MTAPGVVGLDLSITTTGAVFYSDPPCTITPAKGLVGDQRLTSIRDQVTRCLAPTLDPLVVIEGPVLRSQAALALGLLHGVIRAALMDNDIPYALVPPATLKKYATGKGNAGKPEMAVALFKRFGLELGDDNQVDAFWLRAMGMDALGAPLVDLPAAQRDAMTRVAWPS